MFLKNYTSNVPVSETLRRIEQVLLQCGVTGIMKEYGLNQKITAVTFRIPGPEGKPIMVRLPADEEKATEALWRDYMGNDLLPDGKVKWSSRKRQSKSDFTQQGERTAWRIMKDWVEVQMSLIQLRQADVIEVFLPYIYDGTRTYFQMLRESKYAGLLGEGKKDSQESNVVDADFTKTG